MATARSSSHYSKNTSPTELLRSAAACGNAHEVVRLLGEGAKTTPDETGCNPLHLAASAGYAKVVAALILAGCDVNACDLAGCSALQRAASQGHVTVVKQLIKYGADVNHQDNVHGNSALHEASWKGYSQTVAALCKGAAQLQLKNRGGFAALHLCCQNGHNQSCRELLFAGCNPDVQNNYGDTSLHTSARYGHAGVTRILISAQCRVSDQNKNGDTALHIAAAMGRKKLTRILLEAGCDKSLRNKQNETARDIATRKDLKEILAILNTPPIALKAQSENRKRDAVTNKSVKKGRSGPVEHLKNCEKDECRDRKRDKNGSGTSSKESNSQRKDKKHKNAHKVHFERSHGGPSGRQWSPYGCHYYPDPEAFPAPNLDSLPDEPLQKGEQYFLDLAGNICKGPVGVGYTCYCAPFFRNVEARLERDKQELKEHIDRAHERLDRKVSSLEQKLSHSVEQERSQCEARSLRLAEWLCRELSGFEGQTGFAERPSSLEHSQNKGATDEIRKAKSLELLSYDDADKWEESREIELCGLSGSVDQMDLPVSSRNVETSDGALFPGAVMNPYDNLVHNWRLQHVRTGRRRSVERECNSGWSLDRDGDIARDDGHKQSIIALKHDLDESAESSDGEVGLSQEVPSSVGLKCEDGVEVLQESNPQQVPDYENIVSCEHTLWKSGGEKHILSELPYRSRSGVYDNALSSSITAAPDCNRLASDLHSDCVYSTKVCESAKGPSHVLSGNMECKGSISSTKVNSFISNVITDDKELKNSTNVCYPQSTINESDDIQKSGVSLKQGYKVNCNISSGSMV